MNAPAAQRLLSSAPGTGSGTRVAHVFADLEAVLDEQTIRLVGLIDPVFLAEAGWEPVTRTLTLAPEHPLLGRSICGAPGCQTTCAERTGFCLDCRRRLAASGLSVQDVALLPPPRGRRWLGLGDGRCVVAGCPRPWSRSERPLCRDHLAQQQSLEVDIDAFIAHPGVVPLPSWGVCAVAACHRQLPAAGDVYCGAHVQRLRALRRAGQDIDEPAWRASEPPIARAGQVNMSAIRPEVVAELLFGLQQRTRQGVQTSDAILRPICMDVRRQQVSSLAGYVVPVERGTLCRSVVNTMVTHVRRGLASPDTEILKDTWDMTLFGHQGYLSFTGISQPWLREAAKVWAVSDLPRRRGRSGQNKTRHYLSSVALLSQSLRQRPDHGQDPSALGRNDIDLFINRLAFLESTATISAHTRLVTCREVRKLLTTLRQLGATRPAGPAAGLSDQFALHRDDVPAEPDQPEPGRDLPAEIMRQLCDHLDLLTSPPVRTAIEILIDTGRRPEDVVALPLDCLAQDPNGAPVLVYDNHKANRLGRRLPISAATAQAIHAQQQRVRSRYPDTPTGMLKLLPTGRGRHNGSRPLTAPGLSVAHREWADTLPLLLPDGTAYDKDRVIPYAYRHTYAQRHADAGVPIDVLAELLDHRNLNVTRRYYRVGESRRREAVDKVTAMAFDRHGNRIWREAAALLDAERTRYAIGDVAVPYGSCSEPSNVQAGGGACPVRFRCAGCDHFRTDVSHLPDLSAYLDDLLRTRERLTASIEGLDDWARTDAMPAQEEITRIRRLISRIKGDMAELTDTERAQIDEAIAEVRRHRSVHLGIPALRPQAAPLLLPPRIEDHA
jgi:integrase